MHPETVLESNDIETVAPVGVGDTLGYARISTVDRSNGQFIEANRDQHEVESI